VNRFTNSRPQINQSIKYHDNQRNPQITDTIHLLLITKETQCHIVYCDTVRQTPVQKIVPFEAVH